MTKFGDVLTTDTISTGGTTILNGSGPPADALGAVGNYYLDTAPAAKILYGPKAVAGTFGSTENPSGVVYSNQDQKSNWTLGTLMRILVAGRITGIRFYRPFNATESTHKCTLYSGAGAVLATANTSGETGSGWQTPATFATPVTVAANTDLVPALFIGPGAWYAYGTAGVGTSTVPTHVTTVESRLNSTTGDAYPSAVASNGYLVDILFQPNLVWPIALKSAP